jgi:dihydrodipicolinate synthase/N-acetylneuraminate lyase
MRVPPRTLPALITPCATDGAIDENAHRHNLNTMAGAGVGGFVIGGSTGLGPYLMAGERGTLIGLGREVLGPEAYLLCGIQAESIAQALSQLDEAVSAGADAALVMTPTTLIRGNDPRVAFFYRELADTSPLPLFLYSVPATTGYQLPIELAAELAAHPNIVGLKDSGAEANRAVPLASVIANGFTVMAGSSGVLNEFVLHGAHGAITASANYAHDLVSQALDNEYAQEELTPLAAAVQRFGLAGTYAAAEAVGLTAGAMRLPLQPLEGAKRAAVNALVA